MPSYLPPETGGDFELPPEGNHLAVCYRVIDIGTQRNEYQGEVKHQRQVIVSWELAHEHMKDGRPFSVHKFYTWSMHEKANLRHDLEAWRGKPFDPKVDFGPSGFNIKKLLGAGCMVQVVHTASGKSKITTVASLPKDATGKRMVAPLAVNPLVFFDLDERPLDEATLGTLSESLKKKIMASPEYQDAVRGAPPAGNASGGDLDDEIPF
jgi:hypothetical protein